jgi:mono/diheme cytochrome c family protein
VASRVGPMVAGVALVAIAAALILLLRAQNAPRVDLRAVVNDYCAECHNAVDWDGGIAFDTRSPTVHVASQHANERESAIWEKAARKVRAGMMPPARAARPAAAVLDGFAAAVEQQLDGAWSANPNPGTKPLSRLNRTQYRNAVRDLLAFDATSVIDTLPVDEVVDDFDNIGDGLSVSPTLIEAYVGAAMTIARQAVGDRTATATQVRYEVPDGLRQDAHIDGLPLGTRGGFVFTHNFPLDAVYEVRVTAIGSGPFAVQMACPAPQVIVALDGRMLELEDPAKFRIAIPAGPHEIAAAVQDHASCAGVNDLYDVYSLAGGVRNVEILGPYDATGPGDTPSRRAIFECYPRAEAEQDGCARRILTRLASRAYRRPLADDGPALRTLLGFYEAGRAAGGFEAGIERAVARVLMSPQFLFFFEHEPEGLEPGRVYTVSDLDLATRLSLFLWSSIPDDELLAVAARGELHTPASLASQVDRMLADPRAQALTDNFAGQWLSIRELKEALPQDRDFDANLRAALEQQTRLSFSRIVNRDLSVLELLDSDSTYLNERLARHYGIAGVRGSHMREVALGAEDPRRGLLGQGSWLTATSVADRTSPVVRGKWFLTHLLGVPVPAPPPGVEADLSDGAKIAREDDTLRERLERHRANPTCAACHQIMDPIGLALENFDLVGRWREQDRGKPIDATAVLNDGRTINGPNELRRLLLSKSDLFVTTLTERLLTYALGRVLDDQDAPVVRQIVRHAAADHYRFGAILRGVIASAPFQQRVKTADAPPAVADRGTD